MSAKKRLGAYFLHVYAPFTQKKTVIVKAVLWVSFVGVLGCVAYILFAGGAAEKSESAAKSGKSSAAGNDSQAGSKKNDGAPKPQGADYISLHPQAGYGGTRNYAASQIVKAESGFGRVGLPMASLIAAQLIGKVVTSDSATPTIAVIPQDVSWEDDVLIPEGSKALGQTTFDESTQRVQVRFHGVVFPDGTSHSISGLALSADGSAGLSGEYHSGTIGQQVGKFLSMFIGGLSDGMKDRQPSQGPGAPPYEPGSLRNGALNGLAVTSSEFAKSKSQELERSKPFMELPSGMGFVIYLDKEFVP